MKKIQFDMNLYKSVRQLLTKERLYGFVFCLCDFICYRCLYIYIYICTQRPCVSLSTHPPLAVGDSGAAAQFYDHLLAVVEGPLVSQLLQGAGSVGQHAHPLARSRKKGRRKVAARQHHSLRLLPLARPHLTLLCTHTTHKNKNSQLLWNFG